MKISVLVILATLTSSALAVAGGFGEGYYDRLRESRNHPSRPGEWVYLNSPGEYRGPGRLAECRKVSTYQGGPKGWWRTYYVCRVAQ